MIEKVEKIIDLIKNENPKEQINIIIECASRIGTPEWQKEVRELDEKMREIEERNKKVNKPENSLN